MSRNTSSSGRDRAIAQWMPVTPRLAPRRAPDGVTCRAAALAFAQSPHPSLQHQECPPLGTRRTRAALRRRRREQHAYGMGFLDAWAQAEDQSALHGLAAEPAPSALELVLDWLAPAVAGDKPDVPPLPPPPPGLEANGQREAHLVVRAKQEAELQAQEEAEEKAKVVAELKAKQEAEQQALNEAEEAAKEEAELKAKQEAELQALKKAEEAATAEAELKAKQEAELQAKQEAELPSYEFDIKALLASVIDVKCSRRPLDAGTRVSVPLPVEPKEQTHEAESSGEEEELVEVPGEEAALDSFFLASIRRKIGGVWYRGVVDGIEVDPRSMERLYRIRYDDGDLEHMTKAQVSEFSFSRARRR